MKPTVTDRIKANVAAVMTRRRWLAASVGVAVLLEPRFVRAQATLPHQAPKTVLSITGSVAHPRTLTLEELRALPSVNVEITQGTYKGIFEGPLLWSLLEAAAPIDEVGPKTRWLHGIIAKGGDGYGVLVAVGEVSPELEGKQVIVAYAQNGKPLPALMLIVPGDKAGRRFVLDLAVIEVR